MIRAGAILALAAGIAAAPKLRGAAPPAARAQKRGAGQTVNQTVERIPNPQGELRAQIQAALDKKDYVAAAPLLARYLEGAPGDAIAHFQLGYADTALERWTDAETEYRRAAQLDPKLAPAQLNLGLVLLRRDPAAAAGPLRQAAQLTPDQPRPHMLLALALERAGKPGDAVAEYRAAARLDDKNFDAHYELARALLALGEAGQAEPEFRRALELQPAAADAQAGLAESLLEQKKNDEGAQALETYLQTRPADEKARLRLISALAESGKFDDALAQLDRIQVPGPNELAAYRLRAQILLGRNQFADAVAPLMKTAQLAPNDPAVHAQLGHALVKLQKFTPATPELIRAVQLDPKDTQAWNDLVVAQDMSGNWAGALDALDHLEQIEPLSPISWFLRASCNDHLNRLADAIAAYRKFLQVDDGRFLTEEEESRRRLPVLEDLLKHQKR
ncbi:MAG TPA: tetratricopeptide repeat protein [Candidatus Acidoferrales bacterium]|nr:tetratricopeptide repeat protein [Candidatus Acidoferrales bacterium]